MRHYTSGRIKDKGTETAVMHDKGDVSRHAIRNVMTRDFILGFSTFFIFFVANFTLTPTMPVYLKNLGSSVREIGEIVGVLGIASLVSRLLVGRALREYPEKRIMMVGAAIFTFTFLAFIAFRPFWPLLAVRFLQGVAFSCMDTAAIAYVISTVPPTYRTRAISYIFLAPSLAMSVAAPFGMFLMNRYSFKVLLLTGAALSACAFSFSLGLGERKAVDLARNPSANGTVLIEWKIVAPAMTGFLQYVVWSSVSAFFPLYAVQCGVGNPGIFFSAMALMMLIGRTFGGRIFETWGKQKIIVTFMTLSIAALVMLSFSRTLPLFIFIGLLWGMAAAFVFPTCMAYALDYAGTSGGTALGTYQAFTDLGVALGPVVTGTILSLTGYGQVFLFLACICVFNLCYSRHYVWKKHDERQKVRNVL